MLHMTEMVCIAMSPKVMHHPAPDSLQEIRQHVGASFSPRCHAFRPKMVNVATKLWWKITIFNGKLHYNWPFSIALSQVIRGYAQQAPQFYGNKKSCLDIGEATLSIWILSKKKRNKSQRTAVLEQPNGACHCQDYICMQWLVVGHETTTLEYVYIYI